MAEVNLNSAASPTSSGDSSPVMDMGSSPAKMDVSPAEASRMEAELSGAQATEPQDPQQAAVDIGAGRAENDPQAAENLKAFDKNQAETNKKYTAMAGAEDASTPSRAGKVVGSTLATAGGIVCLATGWTGVGLVVGLVLMGVGLLTSALSSIFTGDGGQKNAQAMSADQQKASAAASVHEAKRENAGNPRAATNENIIAQASGLTPQDSIESEGGGSPAAKSTLDA